MKKFFGGFLIVVLAAAVFLIVAKDWVLKSAVEISVSRLTGFETKLDDLKYDFPSTIQIRGLQIRNPAGFNQKIFADIPEIYASLVLPELLKGKMIHLPEVRLNVQEINIEKRADGISNVELLSSVGKGKAAVQAEETGTPSGQKKPAIPFLLERLELTIRNVGFEDRSSLAGAVPVVPKRLSVDLNVQKEVFTDIKNPVLLVNLIVVKVLNSATLGRLLNIDPQKLLGANLSGALTAGEELLAKQAGALTQGVGNVTGPAASMVGQAEVSKKAGQLLKGSAGTARDAFEGTGAAVKNQVSGLLGKLKPSQTEEKPAETTV